MEVRIPPHSRLLDSNSFELFVHLSLSWAKAHKGYAIYPQAGLRQAQALGVAIEATFREV